MTQTTGDPMTAAQRAAIAAWLTRARTVIADFIRPTPVESTEPVA